MGILLNNLNRSNLKLTEIITKKLEKLFKSISDEKP